MNTRQLIFCTEYIKDFNGTRAATVAGFSPDSARSSAHRLLQIDEVREMINILLVERMEKVKIDANYVLNRLVEIDQLDIIDILDDHGNLLPIHSWPKTWRTLISGFDISTIGKGDDAALLKKIKWPDKTKNLELIGKHIDIGAWSKEDSNDDKKETPPLNITFDVKEAVRDIKVTRGES